LQVVIYNYKGLLTVSLLLAVMGNLILWIIKTLFYFLITYNHLALKRLFEYYFYAFKQT